MKKSDEITAMILWAFLAIVVLFMLGALASCTPLDNPTETETTHYCKETFIGRGMDMYACSFVVAGTQYDCVFVNVWRAEMSANVYNDCTKTEMGGTNVYPRP